MQMLDSTLVRTTLEGRALVAYLKTGKITDYEKDAIAAEVGPIATAHGWRLILDMRDIIFVGSSGLGMLLALQRSAKAAGGQMVIVGLSEDLMGMLKLSKLDKMLTFGKDVAAAVKVIG
jgi:anti-anti-sigma factor